MSSISLSKIDDAEFLALRSEWNALLNRSVTNEPFLLWEWIYSWWQAFRDERNELLILVGRDSNGRIVGIAPFYKEKRRRRLLGHGGTIRFCSSVEVAPDHLDVICEKQSSDPFLKAVFKYLIDEEENWDVIKLEGVDENAVIKAYVTTKAEGNNVIVNCTPDSDCPFLSISESYENYIKSFSRKKRYNLQRERRILLQDENAIFERIDKDLEKHLLELFALHAERAKRKGIESSFMGSKIVDFHRNFSKWNSEEGKVVLFRLRNCSQTLAYCYCIRHQDRYYYYQTGISNDGEEKSAGSVLLSLVVEKAFEERCNRFDFLRGREEYKYYWTKDTRRNFVVSVRRNAFADRVFDDWLFYRGRMKTGLKRILMYAKHSKADN